MAIKPLTRPWMWHALALVLVALCAFQILMTGDAHAADPSPKTLCANAGKLFQAKQYEQAKEVYVSLLGAPECEVAASRLVAIGAIEKKAADAAKAKADNKTWPERNRKTMDSWGEYLVVAGAALVWIGKLLLFGLGLLWLIWLVGSLTRKYINEQVRVEPIVGLGGDDAAAVRASFKGVLQEMAADVHASGTKPSIVQLSTEPDFKLPDSVTSAEPKTALVNAIIDLIARVSPTRDVCVVATCHAADEVKGAGVTVEVERPRGRLSDYWSRPTSVTIWENEFELKPEDESG